MNIVAVTEVWHPHQSEVVTVLDLHRQALYARGHEVTVLTPDRPQTQALDPFSVTVPAIPLPGSSGYHLSFPGLGRVDSVIAKADLVTLHQPFELSRYVLQRATATNTPVLYVHHPSLGISKATIDIGNRAQAVITDDGLIELSLRKAGLSVPLYTVPVGIDLRSSSSASPGWLQQRLALPAQTDVLLGLDPTESDPRYDVLIDALARMDESPHFALVPDSLAARRQLNDAVTMTRRGHHIHVLESHSNNDQHQFFTSPSFVVSVASRAHPRWLLKASAVGLPSLSLRQASESPYVLNRQTGLVVPPTATAVVRGLRQLLHRPALRTRLGKAAQTHAASFSLDRMTDRLVDVFHLTRKLVRVER
ncbi:glycosyltransferase [Candidatus Berkelbacteria bacterium]|nr:glycosyltransferase [Candidatus Berkelbacteria bacterium]